jgi:uncharacterized protein
VVLAKILLLVVALGFGYWLWRHRAGRHRQAATPPTGTAAKPPQPQPMARCTHCDVHMPRADMVSGHLGLYCSAAHRQAHGDQAPR